MRWKLIASIFVVLTALLASAVPAFAADPGAAVTASSRTVVAAAPVGAIVATTGAISVEAEAVSSGATVGTTTVRVSSWRRVVTDYFSGTTLPSHYFRYDGPYGSGPRNCATPANVFVKTGNLNMVMRYRSSGNCGAGWYTGGLMISSKYGAVDQRITLRFRVLRNGIASHFVMPMRWPTTTSWPLGGEEDYCETDSLGGCYTFLHYSSANSQVYHAHKINLSQWHTMRVQRYDHVVKVFLDDLATPVWVYRGSSTTLPDTIKRLVLQQECQSSCPSGHSGTETIQIAWLTVDDRR